MKTSIQTTIIEDQVTILKENEPQGYITAASGRYHAVKHCGHTRWFNDFEKAKNWLCRQSEKIVQPTLF